MGFPSLKKISEHYKNNSNVVSLAIQTVFEGQQVNTFSKLKPTAKQFHLTNIPFGHDAGNDGKRSNILTRYRTRGTPWDIIIDPKGIIRYSTFTRGPAQIIAAIDRILKDNDLVGQLLHSSAPDFSRAKWVGGRIFHPYRPGHLTLVKLWRGTEDEAATIRDLEAWTKKQKKVSMILVRVPKAGESLKTRGLKAEAKKLGHRQGLVVDLRGQILASFQKLCGKPHLQSLIFLVDGQGQVAWSSFAAPIRNAGPEKEGGQAFADLKQAVRRELRKR